MSITTILGTDVVKDSRAVINANFTYLDEKSNPAGANGQIQFNDDGAFGGARFNYTESVNNSFLTHTGNGSLNLVGSNPLGSSIPLIEINETFIRIKNQFEISFSVSSGDYGFKGSDTQVGILDFSNIATSNKTFTFPNVSGDVAVIESSILRNESADNTNLSIRGKGTGFASIANTDNSARIFAQTLSTRPEIGSFSERIRLVASTSDFATESQIFCSPTGFELSAANYATNLFLNEDTIFFQAANSTYSFENRSSGRELIVDTTSITGSNKTFTFPNATGTVGTVITKDTTGDPSETIEGLFCTNTFDNNFKVYADGGWRTITTW